MKIAFYIKKNALRGSSRVKPLLDGLRAAGCELCDASDAAELPSGTEMLLSLGGDGTFLMASRLALKAGVPVLGVNFGRLGFLSANTPDSVLRGVPQGLYSVEERTVLSLRGEGLGADEIAVNEVSLMRSGAGMLGVDICIDGAELPTYWGDGVLVSTSQGSTAYNLSVGGPVCTPDSRVLIVSPIAPHNLNVRPLVIPESSGVRMRFRARNAKALLMADNHTLVVPQGTELEVRALERRLRIVRLDKSNFINALRSRLLWGEDVRNNH